MTLCKWLLVTALFLNANDAVDSFQKSRHLGNAPLKTRGGGDDNHKSSTHLPFGAVGAQYAPAAASLFGNMITPASILGGAIIPISFASGLAFYGDGDESKFAKCELLFACISVQ